MEDTRVQGALVDPISRRLDRAGNPRREVSLVMIGNARQALLGKAHWPPDRIGRLRDQILSGCFGGLASGVGRQSAVLSPRGWKVPGSHRLPGERTPSAAILAVYPRMSLPADGRSITAQGCKPNVWVRGPVAIARPGLRGDSAIFEPPR
jgi:hypothetical protein